MSGTLRAASSISALTLVSRILGLIRDVMMVRLLGASWGFGMFIIAWTFPNMLRRLMGEGALSASFIPVFASTLDREGKPAAARLLASVSGALLLGLTLLTVVVVALCFALPTAWFGSDKAGSPGVDESGALMLKLSAILFPYVILVCLVAVYNGALNSLSVFAWPAALPAVLNVFWIGALVVGASLYSTDAVAILTLLSVTLLAAGAVQLAIPAIMLRRRDCLPRPRLPQPGDPARAVFTSMAPTVLGMSLLQLNTLIDLTFVHWAIDPSANVHVYNANRLVSFPLALTTLALATAVFPSFALLASREQLSTLKDQAGRALRYTLFLSAPASVGLILVTPDFIELFFVSGKFTLEDARWSSLTTACLVAGLPFVGSAQLYARALYTLGDLRTPALIAGILVPTNLVLNTLFIVVLDLGVPGVALATSLCAVLHTTFLRRRFASRCASPIASDIGALARIAGCTALMGGAVWWAQTWFAEVGVARLAVPIILGVGIYGACHWVSGGEEMRRFAARLRR